MQPSQPDNAFTVGNFLQFPFDQWNPETLKARAENKEIPFQTSNHQSIVVTYLIQNKEKIQTVFDKSVRPIIDIQNRMRADLQSGKKSELDILNLEESTVVTQNLQGYLEVLNIAQWVLPAEGFVDLSMEPETEMPKCFGIVSMAM